MTGKKEAALAYAKRGWRVIPVDGKRPTLVNGGVEWQLAASSDTSVITEWWGKWPDANVGILCDKHFGFVLDIDDPAILSFLPDLPKTLEARTPSGGRHLVFQHPAGIEVGNHAKGLRASAKIKGYTPQSPTWRKTIDVRGPSGQIVVSPSPGYSWVDADCPIAPAPLPLLQALRAHGEETAVPDRAPVVMGHYEMAAAEKEATALSLMAPHSGRGTATYAAAAALGSLSMSLADVEKYLLPAVDVNGLIETDGLAHVKREIQRGWLQGFTHPRPTRGFSPGFAERLAARAAPATETSEVEGKLPEIRVNGRHLPAIIEDAWVAEMTHGDQEGRLYQREGQLVRMVNGTISEVTSEEVFSRLLRVASWVKVNAEGVALPARPPDDVVLDMRAMPPAEVPRLEAIVSSPVFTSGGAIVASPGYHPEARLWYRKGGLSMEVPPKPSEEDVRWAKSLLIEDLLVDFPFATEADRTHAIAMLLLPFMRRMVPGCTPLHLIEAATPGTGKGFLASAITTIVLGHPVKTTVIGSDEYGVQQKINSALSEAPTYILLDNIKEGIDSANLASALTSLIWSDRILGKQKMMNLPNLAVWCATANNPKLTLEVARRCARIRIVARQDRPWLRTEFKHTPLLRWVEDNREDLVRASLLLIQSWVAAGSPRGGQTLGSFEGWARTVGGVLEHVGIGGFLENSKDLYENADRESQEWVSFVELWEEAYQNKWVKAADLLKIILQKDVLSHLIQDAVSEKAQKIRVGTAIQKVRDRVFGGKTLVMQYDAHEKTNVYRVVSLSD